VRQARAAARLETALAWEPAGQAPEEVRESIGAVEAPFVEQRRLVCMDLRPGALLLEEGAAARTDATGPAAVAERLKAWGAPVLSLGSDRAKALGHRAETGWECLSRPACFHGVQAIVQRSSLPIGQRLRHARQELTTAHEALARRQEQRPAAQEAYEAPAVVAARQADGLRGAEAHHPSRGH